MIMAPFRTIPASQRFTSRHTISKMDAIQRDKQVSDYIDLYEKDAIFIW
jgi:hypothetical protein